jgi:hypothetical protein
MQSRSGRRAATRSWISRFGWVLLLPAYGLGLLILIGGGQAVLNLPIWLSIAGLGYLVAVVGWASVRWFRGRRHAAQASSDKDFGQDSSS